MQFRSIAALVAAALFVPVPIDASAIRAAAHRKHIADVRVPPAQTRSTVALFEAPAPPRPTPEPASRALNTGVSVENRDSRADHFIIRASFMSGIAQTRRFELAGGAKTIRGTLALDAYGAAQALPYGVLNVGTDTRFVQAGDQQDPMGGLVFFPGRATGVAYVDAAHGTSVFDVQRNYGAHTVGASKTIGRARLAILTNPSHPLGGAFAGVRLSTQTDSASVVNELWVGPSGLAVGQLYQTAGRLFVESSNAFATPGVPLAIDDLQRRENAGYKLSPALTVRGGMAAAYGAASSAYFNATLVTRNASASISKVARSMSAAIESHGESSYAEFSYASAPQERDWRLNAAHVVGHGQIDVVGSFLRGAYSDARVEWRSSRGGTALLAGVEHEQQGATRFTGPLAGLSVPLDSYLTAEVELRPTAGRQNVRLSFAQRIDVGARRHVTRTALAVTGSPTAGVLCFIDGSPVPCEQQNSMLEIDDGDHTLVVESADYRFSSLPLQVNRATRSVDARLFAVRAIAGRVVLADPQNFVAPPQLDGIEVQLSPGTASTSTSADGSFILPSAPIAPGAALQIVDESLPEGLSAGDAAAVSPQGTVTLVVHSSRRIERTRIVPKP